MMTTAAITPNSNHRDLPLLPADAPLFELELDLGICERFAITSLSESSVFWACRIRPAASPELSRQYTTSKANVN